MKHTNYNLAQIRKMFQTLLIEEMLNELKISSLEELRAQLGLVIEEEQ